MNRFLVVLCCLSMIVFKVANANNNNAHNPTISLINFKNLFDSQKTQLSTLELSNAFYALKGSQLLGETQTSQVLQDICNLAKTKVDKTSIESIFYATSLANIGTNCQLALADLQATLKTSSESTNVPTLYYYVNSALNLKQKVDFVKVNKNLLDGLKADSSVMNQAYALSIAYHFTENQKPYYNNIEDLLDQADEVDKRFLQFEGGVAVTSFALEGMLNLCEKLKQFPAKFDQIRVTKFVNYLISKRYPTNVRSAYFLLRASLKFTDNQFAIPVVANRLSSISISASQSNMLIGLTNIIGTPVKQTKFTLEALTGKNRKANGPELFSGKKTFTAKSSDGTTFELKLIEKTQPQADFYVIALNIVPKPADKRFYLIEKDVEVKVTTTVNIVDVQLGVADRDQNEPKYIKLAAGNAKLTQKLEADQLSKFFLKFDLKDKAKGTPLEVHQSFVRITHLKSKREIVFLAQMGTNKQYLAEIDFSKNAKNFRNTDGLYSVELIVADALIENPTTLSLVDINLRFNEQSTKSSDKSQLYTKKPEIKHLFRPSEKMPPVMVSTVFTGLCLLPVVIMVLAWMKIGFNFSKFRFSLSGLVFHLALGAIFGLYYCYWTHLNMFQTIKYLTVIGGVALFFGQRLLRSLAAEK